MLVAFGSLREKKRHLTESITGRKHNRKEAITSTIKRILLHRAAKIQAI